MPQNIGEANKIIGVGKKSKELIVQKSNPLSALWKSDLTLPEFKIMDSYLARINSHEPDNRSVRFEKGELERILGVGKINVSELKERVRHLMMPLIIDTDDRGFIGISLFEEAVCYTDEHGMWVVDLECTQKAMKYFFNIEQLGYYRYKLRCIAGLSSRYSYILFQYIEQNRFRKSWEIDLDDLKQILCCEEVETYKQFKNFNRLLLRHCWEEINGKTECKFSYEPIKKGRWVGSVKFTVQTLADFRENLSDAAVLASWNDTAGKKLDSYRSAAEFLHEAVSEFSEEEFDRIFSVLQQIDIRKLPTHDIPAHDSSVLSDVDFRRYAYLTEKSAVMGIAAAKRKITDRFQYFMKLIELDMASD